MIKLRLLSEVRSLFFVLFCFVLFFAAVVVVVCMLVVFNYVEVLGISFHSYFRVEFDCIFCSTVFCHYFYCLGLPVYFE